MPQGGEGLRGRDSLSSPRGQRDWVDFSALWFNYGSTLSKDKERLAPSSYFHPSRGPRFSHL